MTKKELHPRNRHRGRYDFKQLIQAAPELARFVATNKYGDESIDFADPHAVKALNQAILKQVYGVSGWDIPKGFLCPPIPGRADYIHHVADLLGSTNGDVVPQGSEVRVLDIGTGANCVYPLIGHSEYGWSFVGTDIDPDALRSAQKVLSLNDGLTDAIELRLQKSPEKIFEGIIKPGETFDLAICNPPFHASQAEAQEGTQRKWKNLGKSPTAKGAPVLNFGGTGAELWCKGGERAFIERMIKESARFANQCRWFTTLLSRESHLPAIGGALKRAGTHQQGIIEMVHGQKKSRIVAWSFQKSK